MHDYAYAYMKYAYASMKHAHAYTPRNSFKAATKQQFKYNLSCF